MLRHVSIVLASTLWLLASPALAQGDDARAQDIADHLRLQMLRLGPPRGATLSVTEDEMVDMPGRSDTEVFQFLSVGDAGRPSYIVEWHINGEPGALAEITQLLPTDDVPNAIAQRLAGLPMPIDAITRLPSLRADILIGIAPDNHIVLAVKGDVILTVRSFGPIRSTPLAEQLMQMLFPDP